jgi:N-methylhydantoinase B
VDTPKIVSYRAGQSGSAVGAGGDPVVTEVIRHGLNSAAEQMKRALIRTAFSPIIYEVLDFAVAIYDRRVRLLAQAPSLPVFMGTLSFCVENAVEAVGGEANLEPGDILLYNVPYGTGTHPQDAALVMPVFLDDAVLVGYTALKGHWLDIGGKEPYSTDTVDVFQEGTIFPGVKLYRRGRVVDDVERIVLANSRMPKMVAGDISAEVVALRTGSAALLRVVRRYGIQAFEVSVERMFDHGEAIVRGYFEKIPDGRYSAWGMLDDNGIEPEPVPFEVVVTVAGSDVTVDFTKSPATQIGPINCPQPDTVSASRVAIMMLAGGGEAPNEGHMRPIVVETRPGSMFHALSPAPCFLVGWASGQAIEVIYKALADGGFEGVPASSGGDLLGLVWWGTREMTGEPWGDGSPHPVGQGAGPRSDGANALMHVSESATRMTAVEVWEAKNPWLIEKVELARDSGGAGRFRGGLGLDIAFRMLEDCWVTAVIERTKNAPWGLAGGRPGRANGAQLRTPDGNRPVAKATRLKIPAGSVLELYCGGGGGFGPPSERDVAEVQADIQEGYISEGQARADYPHAFIEPSQLR